MRLRKDKEGSSCDWRTRPASAKRGEKAAGKVRVHRHRKDFSWSGVKTERYKSRDGTWHAVLRRVLVGEKGENVKFNLRYFELSPGGYTTLEQHRHEHVVIGVRGSGTCRASGKTYNVGFLDTLYIPPMATHQLINTSDEPFGFFCVVDARRDRPKAIKG
jgi:ribulose-bisphosphate carboxylase large chain